jgi:hypothetical protein
MRSVAIATVVALSTASYAQGLQVAGRRVELGPPTAVAVGVTEAFWKPDGRAIAYYATDSDGPYLGTYNLETGKAKALLRFAEGTNVHFEAWLPQRTIYLVAVSRKVVGRDAKRYSLHTLDAQNLVAREVWSAEYLSSEEVSISVDASPSLDHALVTIGDSKGRTPIVLLNGGMNAVMSRDVAQAWAQGMEFTGWSVDGTAYFNAPAEVAVVERLQDVAVTSRGTFQIELKIEGGNVLSGVPLIGKFLLSRTPIAPDAGTPVYELMPGNAVLRPVLSRGPFVGKEKLPHVVYPVLEDTVATSHERRDGTGALWMVRLTGIEGAPYGKDGVLIAALASKFWMCEDGNWVAYESGGALFVRRITYGGRPFSADLTKGG